MPQPESYFFCQRTGDFARGDKIYLLNSSVNVDQLWNLLGNQRDRVVRVTRDLLAQLVATPYDCGNSAPAAREKHEP